MFKRAGEFSIDKRFDKRQEGNRLMIVCKDILFSVVGIQALISQDVTGELRILGGD